MQEMIKRTYHGGFMPNHIIFDNNCTVAKHVKHDPNFANVGLIVDVFHFENKHADSDEFCRENCDVVDGGLKLRSPSKIVFDIGVRLFDSEIKNDIIL
jgi:hypothetical protein